MKNYFPDIPFERLDPDCIRALCAMGVEAMTVSSAMESSMRPVMDLDIRICAMVRLSSNTEGGRLWRSHRENKNAVLALLSLYVDMKRERPNRYLYLSHEDAASAVLMEPDVISFVMKNHEEMGYDRMTGYNPLYSAVNGNDIYNLFRNNPAMAGSFGAMSPTNLQKVQNSVTLSAEEKMSFFTVATGFLHKWENDTPAFLRPMWEAVYNEEHSSTAKVRMKMDDFDALMLRVCTLCRKDAENMARIKRDLAQDSTGGKKSRHREAGWLTRYMEGLYGSAKIERIKELVTLVPPLMSLVPSKARNCKELRSLKRLYQMSGDYE